MVAGVLSTRLLFLHTTSGCWAHASAERYEEYLASFGEGEAELKKKVEQELGWSLLQLKQRVAGGVGSSWSAMPVFGTSGMAGSIIDHRSIGGEKPV